MADFPNVPYLGEPAMASISPACMNSLGVGFGGIPASTAWPAVNLAMFIPFRVSQSVTVTQIALGGGTTASGNFDGGVYDEYGNRLISTGTQGKVASAEVIVDVSDTTFGPGLFYMGMAADTTTGLIIGQNVGGPRASLLGCREMASAFVLPATATYATCTQGFIPSMALYLAQF
jgi:hypothetical protein